MSESLESSVQTPQVTNIAHVDVDTVHAEMVRMHQSSAGVIHAEDVELAMSAAGQVSAKNVRVSEGAIAALQANTVTIQQGAVGMVQAETLSVIGASGVVVAGAVEMGNVYAGLVAGREIRGERIESLILLSRNVNGNVSTVMDTRGALIAGLVGGLFAGIMLLLGKMLFSRK